MPERNGDVGLAGAGISHEQDVLAQVEIFAAHELGDDGPVDGRLGGEVKHVERLRTLLTSDQQPFTLCKVPVNG